jgi:diguanylate cyclase (GGDEF)-like protein
VLVGREVAAVLEFYSERVEEPDDQLLDVMADVGLQLGRVIERERARAAVERRAEAEHEASLTDELTGLRNRRGFLELVAPRLANADRTGRPALLFFADINGMKQINDALGHEVGDEAIRQLGRLLRTTFRERDVVARLGGDEFVVFAPDAGPERAGALRRRLRTMVDAHNVATGEKPFRLSVSLGAAAYDPARPRDLEALLDEADALMYEQKRLHKRTGVSSVPPGGATTSTNAPPTRTSPPTKGP